MTATRWNDFSRVYPVQFVGEERQKARALRLSSHALRAGDPVRVTDQGREVDGVIVEVVSAVIVVRRV